MINWIKFYLNQDHLNVKIFYVSQCNIKNNFNYTSVGQNKQEQWTNVVKRLWACTHIRGEFLMYVGQKETVYFIIFIFISQSIPFSINFSIPS